MCAYITNQMLEKEGGEAAALAVAVAQLSP